MRRMFCNCMKNYRLDSKIKHKCWLVKYKTYKKSETLWTHWLDYYIAPKTLQISLIFNVMNNSAKLVGWLEFNILFQHKYDYIRDEIVPSNDNYWLDKCPLIAHYTAKLNISGNWWLVKYKTYKKLRNTPNTLTELLHSINKLTNTPYF